MNNRLTTRERRHLAMIKALPCGVCGRPGPSYAHHIRQHRQYIAIPLCWDCHQGPQGIHGDETLWRIYRVDELDVLDRTIERLLMSPPRETYETDA